MKYGKIPTEAFDLMQYFYRSAHDPLIRCVIHFDGRVDDECLKKAVDLSIKKLPVIGCRFQKETGGWAPGNYSAEEAVFIKEIGADADEDGSSFYTSSIDIEREPQLKIFVLRSGFTDTLCILMNHMVCDGAGFKDYVYLLGSLYAYYQQGLTRLPEIPDGPRNMRPLFTGLTLREKLALLFSKQEYTSKNTDISPALQGNEQAPFIVARRLPQEEFVPIKMWAKKRRVTLNDMLLTAYIRALHKETGFSDIQIPCPVDLRKYWGGGQKPGLCNLTGNYVCRVLFDGEESFGDTLTKVSDQMNRQKASPDCLKGPFLLNLAYRLLPRGWMRALFFKAFTIPVVSYTNLGVLEKDRLPFGPNITDCFMTAAVKYVPYFQVAVSTCDDVCTLTCNTHGSLQDKDKITQFLDSIREELKDCLANTSFSLNT